MSNWDYAQVVPTEAWRSAITLPRQLVLKSLADGLRLVSLPVKELETLRGKSYSIENLIVKTEVDLTEKLGFSPSLMELEMELEIPEGTKTDFAVALSNARGEVYRVGFDAGSNQFYSDRTEAGATGFSNKFAAKRHTAQRFSNSKTIQLHLFFDVASCELFADNGEVVMTDIYFPTADFSRLKLHSGSSNGLKIKSMRAWELKRVF